MKVSVIIPVYNAENYVRYAVESALAQQEVEEVILIEDGSCDDSFKVCKELESEFEKVVLLRHAGGKNLGAGASRNIGIQNASSEWIAFLDADDFYLQNRFKKACEIADTRSEIGAIGEAVGAVRQSSNLKATDFVVTEELTTVEKNPGTEEFRMAQAPFGRGGYICTDGWTVKKNVFDRTGMFNPKLRLHQDTELFVKFPFCTELTFGETTKPVAMRRWHSLNRISASRSVEVSFECRFDMYLSIFKWIKRRNDSEMTDFIKEKLIRFFACGHVDQSNEARDFPIRKFRMLMSKYPALITNRKVIKYYREWIKCLVYQCYSLIFKR